MGSSTYSRSAPGGSRRLSAGVATGASASRDEKPLVAARRLTRERADTIGAMTRALVGVAAFVVLGAVAVGATAAARTTDEGSST